MCSLYRRQIANGAYDPGQKLPSIEALAKEFGVSVITVRQTIEILENEGLMTRLQGRGTFISEDTEMLRGLTISTDWASLLSHLEDKTPTLLDRQSPAPAPEVPKGQGETEGAYLYLRRTHWSGALPYAWIDIHLAQDIYDLNPEAFDRQMIISTLRSLEGIRIGRLHQRISFTTADTETAEILDVPVNSAIGHVLRVICDEAGRVIYVGNTRYRGDFVNLEINLQEPPE